VNLIGDHTDYTGGLVLPVAIDRWTEVAGERTGTRLRLMSADEDGTLDVPLPVRDPGAVTPAWGRYAAAVAAELGTTDGFVGTVGTDVPVGAGLSSSAAFEVAVALALGAPHGSEAERVALAQQCRRAEHAATGVPCGIMDQLASVAGVEGHALLIDCHTLSIAPVPIPHGVDLVVRFVAHRTLEGSEYADRVAQCTAAEAVIGPLRLAGHGAWEALDDPVLAARARHVITENARVRAMVDALGVGDVATAGQLLVEGHASLRDHFAASTPQMDAAVEAWLRVPGVHGVRMTGGGFGGCIVALAESGALDADLGPSTWKVHAVAGAHLQ
jgi:galactokinase